MTLVFFALGFQSVPQVKKEPSGSPLPPEVEKQIDGIAHEVVNRNDNPDRIAVDWTDLATLTIIDQLMPELHTSEALGATPGELTPATKTLLRQQLQGDPFTGLQSRFWNDSGLEIMRRTASAELLQEASQYLAGSSKDSNEDKVKNISELIRNKLIKTIIEPYRNGELPLSPLIQIRIIRFTLTNTIYQGTARYRLKSDKTIKDILQVTGAAWRSAPLLSELDKQVQKELETITDQLVDNVDWQKEDIASLNDYLQDLKANHSDRADSVQKKISELEGVPYRGWLAVGAVPLSVFVLLTLLLFTKPLWLLTIHRKLAIYDLVAQLPFKSLSFGLQVLLKITLIPLFVHNRRTLDAWVEHHAGAIRHRFEAQSTVAAHEVYVALPVSLDHASATLIPEPSPAEFRMLLSAKRSVIEIIGPGGSGKSTLAIQIARWALDKPGEKSLTVHRMLPVWIEEDFSDLPALLRDKFRIWLGEEVEPNFLEVLLKKKRLLIIIDGFSERDKPTQKLVRHIHASCPVNALVLTTRLPVSLEAGDETKVYPQPLTSTTLLHLLTTLISMNRFNPDENQPKSDAFSSIEDQLELGKKLASLIQGNAGGRLITPLIVKLFVDRAIELVEKQDSIDNLPNSIPEVYFDYLRRVNPSGDGIANQVPDDEMMRAAEVLGELCLGKDFVPREFTRSNARLVLAQEGWVYPGPLDPIQRLVDNGVLVERVSGTDTFLRFLLDPLAEFLGAMACSRRCSDNAERWHDLIQRVEELTDSALGFKMALCLIREVYGKEQAWFMEPVSWLDLVGRTAAVEAHPVVGHDTR
jgi:hypothetical protein